MSFICLKCIGDEPLLKIARIEASKSKCDYCGSRRLCISMEKLAEIVDEQIRNYICIGEDRQYFEGESDRPSYKQEGESLEFILQEELGIESEPSKDLALILKRSDPAHRDKDEQLFYCDYNNYHRSYQSSWRFAEIWQDLSKRIKHKRRFFDDVALEMLADILGAPNSPKAAELPVFEIGPEVVALFETCV